MENKDFKKSYSSQIEIIKTEKNDKEYGYIKGIASKANVIDDQGDMTLTTTFDETISKNPVVKALYKHDWSKIIGSVKLSKSEDGDLISEFKLYLNTQGGNEAYQLAKELQKDGVPMEISVGGRMTEWGNEKIDNKDIIVAKTVMVKEVSLTPFASNPEATVKVVKSADKDKNTDQKQLAVEKATAVKSKHIKNKYI